jgi:hypothetical protein
MQLVVNSQKLRVLTLVPGGNCSSSNDCATETTAAPMKQQPQIASEAAIVDVAVAKTTNKNVTY